VLLLLPMLLLLLLLLPLLLLPPADKPVLIPGHHRTHAKVRKTDT
jgi:hypothetical protein